MRFPYKRRKTIIPALALAMFGVLIFAPHTFALNNLSESTVQAYGADAPLSRGTLVKLDAGKDKATVLPVSQSSAKDIFGVIVNRDDATLVLSGSKSTGQYQVYVARSGEFNVLVSDQNGAIAKDDYISISSLDGIGMMADATQPVIVGRALSAFDGKTNTLGKTTLKDKNGKAVKTVSLGLIPIVIEIGKNPLNASTKANLPGFLEKAGNAIADKTVSPARVYLSIIILVMTLMVAGTVLYTGIKHSVVSIGRNPLSRGSIFKSLMSITLTSIIVLIIGIFAVYLLLKL